MDDLGNNTNYGHENERQSSSACSFSRQAGWLLVVSGVVHWLVFIFIGGDWDGSVSLRKPILFGVSTGVTLLSLAWVLNHLQCRKTDRYLICWLSVFLVMEVALITIQYWRGVPSHFNNHTDWDSAIDNSMFVLITLAFAIILYFSVRSFSSLRLRLDYIIGIRAGMLFLVLSCVIGFVISSYGYQQLDRNEDPGVVSPGGVTKFPHGIAIHALQVFPILSWLMIRTRIDEKERVRVISLAIAAMFLFLTFAIFQTMMGRSRLDVSPVSMTLGYLGAILVICPVVVYVRAFRNRAKN